MTPETVQQTQVIEATRLAELRAVNAHEAAFQSRANFVGKLTSDNVRGVFNTARTDGIRTGQFIAGPDDLMQFEGLGLSHGDVFEEDGSFVDKPFKVQIGQETAEFASVGASGYEVDLTSQTPVKDEDGRSPKSTDIVDRIKQRYELSPFHQAFAEIDEKIKTQDGISTDEVSADFDIGFDRLGSISALTELGVIFDSSISQTIDMSDSQTPVSDFIDNMLVRVRSSWEVEEADEFVHLRGTNSGRPGVPISLKINRRTGGATVGFGANNEFFYSERANQAHMDTSEPFIETVCAKEIIGALQDSGLRLSDQIQREITAVIGNNDRYGSVYTEISRELAKWVNRPTRVKPSNLFASLDPEIKPTEEEIKSTLASIDTEGMGESAKLVFDITKQVFDRHEGDVPTDMPVTNKDINMLDGSCFDVAVYYLGAGSRYLTSEEVNGRRMIHKTTGKETFLAQEPVVFNGINLPKGSLFKRVDDGSWAFLRLTPFTFDAEEDQLATGAEMEKAKSMADMRRVGAITLEELRFTST